MLDNYVLHVYCRVLLFSTFPFSLMTCFNAVATFQVVLEAAVFSHSYFLGKFCQRRKAAMRLTLCDAQAVRQLLTTTPRTTCPTLFCSGVHILVYSSPKNQKSQIWPISVYMYMPALTNGTILTQLHLLINCSKPVTSVKPCKSYWDLHCH